jgi:hypothetical protein
MKVPQRRLWLAAGAMSVGVGAAVAGGAAFAHADTGASDSAKPRVSSGAERQATAHHRQRQQAVAARRVTAVSKPAKTVLPIHLSVIENTLLGAAKPEPLGYSPRARVAAATLPSASAVPTLPSVGAIIPRLFNVLVPLINNTPIRDLLNLVDPVGTPGATVIRLVGVPSSAVLSPTGKVLFELTVPPNPLGPFYVPPAYSTLTEINTATNTVIGVPVNIRGVPIGAPVISADGTRAYQSSSVGTNVTYVTVINTANSTVVGKPVRLDGWAAGGVVLSDDGRYAYQATNSSVGGVSTTTVTAIDTTKVATVGSPLTLQGFTRGSMVLNPDGSRLCVLVQPSTVGLAVIDTADMSLVSPTIATGADVRGGVVVSPDGARAAVTAITGDASSSSVTLTLVDLADGTVIETPTIYEGAANSADAAPAIFSDGGARINQVTQIYDPNSKTTSTVLTVIDSSTGDIVGMPITVPANNTRLGQVLVPDAMGSSLFIASPIENPTSYDSTIITVVDTTDATVVGTPVTLAGHGTIVVGPDADTVYLSAGTVADQTQVSVVNGDGSATGTSPWLTGTPTALLVNHGGSRVYQLTAVGSHTEVTALIATTATTTGAQRANGTVYSALISPDGKKIYDTNNGASALVSFSFPYRVTVVNTSVLG